MHVLAEITGASWQWHQLCSIAWQLLPQSKQSFLIPVLQDTKPIFIRDTYKGADKLKGKVAIITGKCHGRAACVCSIVHEKLSKSPPITC